MLTVYLLLGLPGAAPGGEGDAYLHRIVSEADFEKLSIPEGFLPGVDRVTKFLVPARDDPALLPTVFQNVNIYRRHEQFLAAEFPERFPGLDGEEYLALVERRTTRSYFAGVLYRFARAGPPAYGFDVFTLSEDPSELPLQSEVLSIFQRLSSVFTPGSPAYAPRDPGAVLNARSWQQPGFPIDFTLSDVGATDYLPYTLAANHGRVRVLTESEFAEANENGGFGSQDIIVLERAPADIEGVIAGVITGSIQSELGHLAIRTARRGTPNAFVKDATERFSPHDGKLVYLEVGIDDYRIQESALPDAEAWWASHRPNLSSFIEESDLDHERFDAAGEALPGALEASRYGGKGANFLRLHTLLPEPNRVPGFVIPFRYYRRFLESNFTQSLRDPGREVTFAEHIEELLADPAFRGDSRTRFAELERLRRLFERNGVVDPELVRVLASRIVEVLGAAEKTVRFRSSSNAEDLLEFNGAGLYDSVSACAADDLDDDRAGPSACDPSRDEEIGIARALRRVWGSLWNFRAYEEREYYQIPHSRVGMAILVSEGFPDELANGVSFTGNPSLRGDRRFVVNAQAGDSGVVFTDPGVVAEKDVLVVRSGIVESILRVRPSSLVPEGAFVLGDESLRELGSVMALVEKDYPVELGDHQPDEVLLDFEFKLDRRTGRIRLKQVRPFLIPDAGSIPPFEVAIEVPEGIVACASFMEGRPVARVLATKARLGLRPGQSVARSDGTSPADLFAWLELSPGGPRLEPTGPGVWRAVRSDNPRGYRLSMEQDLEGDGKRARAALAGLLVAGEEGERVRLDGEALTWETSPYRLHLEYRVLEGDPELRSPTHLLPCDLSHLRRAKVDVALSTGDRLHFEEQFQDLTSRTGPAELVHARVSLGGAEQVIEDYWRLAYSAGHHNDVPYPELWVVLEPPITVEGVGRVRVAAVAQNFRGQEPHAFFLGEDFRELHRPEIVLFRRQFLDEPEVPQFRRGDADLSGRLNVSDAILVLLRLYGGGSLPCPDAADFDDFGSVDQDDAILILRYLFLGLDAPAAPGPRRCGEDVAADELPGCDGAGCR